MFSLATILYLPDHIVTISKRGYYYFAGELPVSDMSRDAAASLVDSASKATAMAARGHEAAVHTAEAAQEAMNWNWAKGGMGLAWRAAFPGNNNLDYR
jgi:hypothetical protein